MRKRTCSLSAPERIRLPLRGIAVGLMMGSLAVISGCGDGPSDVPSEEDGLIEAPVEDENGVGNREFTSERKAE